MRRNYHRYRAGQCCTVSFVDGCRRVVGCRRYLRWTRVAGSQGVGSGTRRLWPRAPPLCAAGLSGRPQRRPTGGPTPLMHAREEMLRHERRVCVEDAAMQWNRMPGMSNLFLLFFLDGLFMPRNFYSIYHHVVCIFRTTVRYQSDNSRCPFDYIIHAHTTEAKRELGIWSR